MGGVLTGIANVLAPALQVHGAYKQQADLEGEQARQKAEKDKSVDALLGTLGPEYEPLRQARKAGMSGEDLRAILGPKVGEQFEEKYKAQKFGAIMEGPGDMPSKIMRAMSESLIDPKDALGFLKPPNVGTSAIGQLIREHPDWTVEQAIAEDAKLRAKPEQPEKPLRALGITPEGVATEIRPGMSVEGGTRPLGAYGNAAETATKLSESETKNAPLGAGATGDAGFDKYLDSHAFLRTLPREAAYSKYLTETKPKSITITAPPDMRTGVARKYRVSVDEFGNEVGPRKQVGMDIPAQAKAEFSQAAQALRFIPDGITSAQAVEQKMAGRTDAQKRKLLQDEYVKYQAGREVAQESWVVRRFDPRASMAGPDADFSHYFTLMGQIQAQVSAPMHIFRATGLFDRIAPHVPEPSDLPKVNLERLNTLEKRFNETNQMLAGDTPDPGAVVPYTKPDGSTGTKVWVPDAVGR